MMSKIAKSASQTALRAANSANLASSSAKTVRFAAMTSLNQARSFSASPAMAKLSKGLTSELQFEQENYAKPEEISKLPAEWTMKDTEGDVNLAITREAGDSKTVTVEWQLVTPFNEDLDGFDADLEGAAAGKDGAAAEEEPQLPPESTDFTITIENKENKAGMMFFCSTQDGEGHRYIIGNVKSFSSETERDSMSSYNGPEFDDLEETLQEAMDEYLAEMGVDNAICDYIDASSVDKEHREYMRWLENVKGFMSGN